MSFEPVLVAFFFPFTLLLLVVLELFRMTPASEPLPRRSFDTKEEVFGNGPVQVALLLVDFPFEEERRAGDEPRVFLVGVI